MNKWEKSLYDRRRYQSIKEERQAWGRLYYFNNRDKVKFRQAQHQAAIKLETLVHYGNGKCACIKCGFDNTAALSIDHVNGGGREDRKTKGRGNSFYQWLKTNNYPEGYQTLCMNCNWIKKFDNNEVRGSVVS